MISRLRCICRAAASRTRCAHERRIVEPSRRYAPEATAVGLFMAATGLIAQGRPWTQAAHDAAVAKTLPRVAKSGSRRAVPGVRGSTLARSLPTARSKTGR